MFWPFRPKKAPKEKEKEKEENKKERDKENLKEITRLPSGPEPDEEILKVVIENNNSGNK